MIVELIYRTYKKQRGAHWIDKFTLHDGVVVEYGIAAGNLSKQAAARFINEKTMSGGHPGLNIRSATHYAGFELLFVTTGKSTPSSEAAFIVENMRQQALYEARPTFEYSITKGQQTGNYHFAAREFMGFEQITLEASNTPSIAVARSWLTDYANKERVGAYEAKTYPLLNGVDTDVWVWWLPVLQQSEKIGKLSKQEQRAIVPAAISPRVRKTRGQGL